MKFNKLLMFLIVGLVLGSSGYAACNMPATGTWNISRSDNCINTSVSVNANVSINIYGNLTFKNVSFVLKPGVSNRNIYLFNNSKFNITNVGKDNSTINGTIPFTIFTNNNSKIIFSNARLINYVNVSVRSNMSLNGFTYNFTTSKLRILGKGNFSITSCSSPNYFSLLINSCLARANVSCYDYNSQRDCIGATPLNVSVNVFWLKSSGGSFLFKNFTLANPNKITQVSSDRFGFGLCRYITQCVKDADNNENTTASLKFGGTTGVKQDCLPLSNGKYNLSCSLDKYRPNTTITPSNTFPHYTNNFSIPFLKSDVTGLNTTISTVYKTYGRYILTASGFQYPNVTFGSSFSKSSAVPDLGTNYTIFYFSEDDSHNLELMKNFTFIHDNVIPEISTACPITGDYTPDATSTRNFIYYELNTSSSNVTINVSLGTLNTRLQLPFGVNDNYLYLSGGTSFTRLETLPSGSNFNPIGTQINESAILNGTCRSEIYSLNYGVDTSLRFRWNRAHDRAGNIASGTRSITIPTTSFIANSRVSPITLSNSTIRNSTVMSSSIVLSSIYRSTVLTSNIDPSKIVNSTIDNSTILNSTIQNSLVNRSIVKGFYGRFSPFYSSILINNSNLYRTNVTESTLNNVNASNSVIYKTNLSNINLPSGTNLSNGQFVNTVILRYPLLIRFADGSQIGDVRVQIINKTGQVTFDKNSTAGVITVNVTYSSSSNSSSINLPSYTPIPGFVPYLFTIQTQNAITGNVYVNNYQIYGGSGGSLPTTPSVDVSAISSFTSLIALSPETLNLLTVDQLTTLVDTLGLTTSQVIQVFAKMTLAQQVTIVRTLEGGGGGGKVSDETLSAMKAYIANATDARLGPAPIDLIKAFQENELLQYGAIALVISVILFTGKSKVKPKKKFT